MPRFTEGVLTMPGVPSRLHVVHVVEAMELGGMERMIATLSRATDPARFKVSVVCIKRIGVVGEQLGTEGIAVHCAQPPRDTPNYFPFLSVARTLRRIGADVVHTHNSPGLMFGAPGAFLAGIHRVVHTEHGRTFPGLRRHLVAERFASVFARYIVGVSEQLTDEMRRYIGIPARKLRTIVNGIEASTPVSGAEADPATLASMGVEPGAVVVGAVGRLVWQKGLVHLLRAWPQVRASSHRAVLLIVGEGELRDELEREVDALGIRDSVRLVGARSDVMQLLPLMRVVVMPSVSEGLPLALLEAMSSGRAIVATEVGGMPKALNHGAAGLLVPPSDPSALADAIITLLTDDERSRALGLVARQRYDEQFTARAMATAYAALYAPDGHQTSPSE